MYAKDIDPLVLVILRSLPGLQLDSANRRKTQDVCWCLLYKQEAYFLVENANYILRETNSRKYLNR